MKKAKLIVVLFFAFSAACVNKQDGGITGSNTAANGAAQAENNRPTRSLIGGGGGGSENLPMAQQVSLNQAENSQNQPVPGERKIIRNADLNLETNSPEEAMTKINRIAESKGGFVVESQQSSSDANATTRDTVTMTVRVPAARFDETLDEIRKTASRVILESVKGEDVTEEFIDIEARLKTEKALEQQFLEIMKQAKSVEDALNVQRQLAQVRGEIEKVEGRRRFLENQASLSTVKVRLQTPTAFSANSSGFFSQLKESFGSGLDAALGFILGLITFIIAVLPFLLLVVLPLALIIRYYLKKRRTPKMANEIAREEIKNK